MTTITRTLRIAGLLAGCSSLLGCSFAARSPEMYQKDTAELLATRNQDIKACYDRELATGVPASGSVVVSFTVKSDTGRIQNAKIDSQQTTAPDTLRACVVDSLDDLTLDPPDSRDGEATYTWNFVK